MRINFGTLKGKNLSYNVPKDFHTDVRPTSAAVKSVLFNLLMHNSLFSHLPINNISVADFCCGTGGVGFEFLSLGVQKCAFFDKHYFNLEGIQNNAKLFNISDRIFTQTVDISNEKYLNKISHNSYDIIFIDPPYKAINEILQTFLNFIKIHNILNPGGFIVIESNKDIPLEHFNVVLKRDVRRKRFLFFLQQNT